MSVSGTKTKARALSTILRSLKSVAVAYSGGVDSTYLLKMATDVLGRDNVLAVIGRSETYPEREFKDAVKLARFIGVRFDVIHTREIAIKGYSKNPVNRCYFCKKELMRRIKIIAEKSGLNSVVDGTNYDDRLDVRYGKKALGELNVKSPLYLAKMTKKDIRQCSREMGLPTHDKPSFACLASRVPFGSAITKKRLNRIDKAEVYLQRLGFRQVRVRDYQKLARIEVDRNEIKNFMTFDLEKISAYFRRIGYAYTTLDLSGYRTGSMNLKRHKRRSGK